MKKLMIAAAIVCAAALSQAATVTWSMSGLKDSTGATLDSGAAYIFCTMGTYATTVAAVSGDLASITTAADLQTYLTNNSRMTLKSEVSGTGAAGVSGADLADSGVPGKTPNVQLFAVIVDDDSFGNDVKYCVTGLSAPVKTPDPDTQNKAIFTVPASATGTKENWKAVPEPTSGLLLLIGVAGLALRRRRA